VGSHAAFDDETQPSACGCAACLERARLGAIVEALDITRVTSIYSRAAELGARDPWTVYVAQSGRVTATGQGTTEEEALHEALRVLGVVT
jgi:hypothetical protein